MRLVAEEVEGRRGGESLFSGLSFRLAPGGALLIRGPNGAGKSTLLRIAAGLLAPTSGRLALEGGRLGAHAHFLSTENAMKPALTVEENLRFWREFLRRAGEDEEAPTDGGLAVGQALDAVDLAHAAALPFGVLSTGQRRRVGLARLLTVRRPLWLLDEPGSGLDQASQAQLSRLMEAHRARGGMVLAAVHDDPGLRGAQEIRLGGT